MSHVSFRDVVKRFGRTVCAVNHVSFEVEDAEFLAILGPSGCGKTTTMRMIAGLESPDSGQICLGGQVVNALGPARRNIAMAFENYGLYPHWSVFGNIAYPLRLQHVSKGEIEQRVRAVAKLLHIEDILSVKPVGLSGGAKQRVGLARALVRRPQVFLLDEPMSHVDPDFRSELRIELKRIQRELGGTFIYVTHDQLEAMSLADRILVMREGVVQQVGTPSEVFDYPKNDFVAGFVGEPPMNFLPTRLCGNGSEPKLSIPNGETVELPSRYKHLSALPNEPDLKLGVRPHKIRVEYAPFNGRGILCTIYVIEPLGDRNIVTLKVGSCTVKVDTPGEFRGDYDQEVYMWFSPDDVLLFKSNGELLR